MTALAHQTNGLDVRRKPGQSCEPRRRDTEPGSQCGPEKRFCDGAAAVIAFAHDKDGFQREPCFRVGELPATGIVGRRGYRFRK